MADSRRSGNRPTGGSGSGSGSGGARTEKRPARDPRSDDPGPDPRNTLPGMTALRWRPDEEGGGSQPTVAPAPSSSGSSIPAPVLPPGGAPAAPPVDRSIPPSARIAQPIAPLGPMTAPVPAVGPPGGSAAGPPPPEPEPRRAPGGRQFGPSASGDMVWKTQLNLAPGSAPEPGFADGHGGSGATLQDMRAVGDDSMATTVPRGAAPVPLAVPQAPIPVVGPAPAPTATTQVTVYKLERPVEFDKRLVMLREPDSAAAAAYRVLRYRLFERGNPRVIVVSSPRAKEGKTTCAVNLALALGECGRARVLLVEANLRAPKLAEMLAFMPPVCFGEQVATHRDQPDEPWTVVEAHSPWLHVAAVKPDLKDRPLIDSPAFAIAIDQLRHAGYDYVVIDTPPVIGTADVNLTQDSADGVLLVIKSRVTAGRHLRRAIEQLAPSRVLGLVMADAPK